jgi:hypothetical protein
MAINNKTISNWIRQSRYRSKKYKVYNDLDITDIQSIVDSLNNTCSYCGGSATTFDCLFPFRNGGPNVPANIALSCKQCRTIKGNNDIIWMFVNGHVCRDTYLELIEEFCKRRGGNIIKEQIKRATGL